ncbi:MAG: hypothetical protein L3J05_01355 [Robiginitomaculum sp.]|nr:hypothetical protein [Robiginitomaculum sp.]
MMRAMKDHELKLVVGGRAGWAGGEPGGDAENSPRFNSAPRFNGTKFIDKQITASATAAPFLMEQPQLPLTTKKPPGRTKKTNQQRRAIHFQKPIFKQMRGYRN